MSDSNHIVKVLYRKNGFFMTRPVHQYDYGQVLQFEGFSDIADTFEMHFASKGSPTSVTQLGSDGVVSIPDSLLRDEANVCGWLFIHDTVNDGETKYVVEIPVIARAAISDDEPAPVEQNAITQAVAALTDAITRYETAVQVIENIASESDNVDDVNDVAQVGYLNGEMFAYYAIPNDTFFKCNDQLYLSTSPIEAYASVIPDVNCRKIGLVEALNLIKSLPAILG